MTLITINYADNSISSIGIKNHSGYAGKGSDIVCAAVSSAAEFFINTLTSFFNADCEIKVNEEPPEISIRFPVPAENSPENLFASKLTRSFISHLENIQKDYPKNISVIKKPRAISES